MNKMQGKITIVPTTKITGSIKSSMVYPALEDLNIKPSKEKQHFKSKRYGYDNVTVEAVDNTIDNNIDPGNIKEGVEILGVAGNVVELQGDTLTVSPSTSTQKIVPESPANGFTEVNVNAVTADIDSNIIPENIKKGTSILGVEGECKGEVETNVFMQETEPVKKDGIWLQGNYEVENIIADTNIFTAGEYNATKTNSLKAIPYSHSQGSAVEVGTDIYLFGSSASKKACYKYDTLTDTYTQLKDIPYDFYSGVAKAIGTDIYLFGSYNSTYSKYTYKYDTLTGTYTKLTNLSYAFYGACGEVVGNNIYLFGNASASAYSKYAYKYNTTTGTYTSLTSIPTTFNYGASAVIGTDIYLFGGTDNPTKAYKYSTLTNSYTQLATIPYFFSKGVAKAVGTDIYLFGGANSYKYVYKYDTLKNTFSQMPNLGYEFATGSLGTDGLHIYLFGGARENTKVQAVTMKPKEFPNKSIVIAQDGSVRHSTNLADVGITNLKTIYDRVYYRDNNGELLNDIPTYNGDGTSWTRI